MSGRCLFLGQILGPSALAVMWAPHVPVLIPICKVWSCASALVSSGPTMVDAVTWETDSSTLMFYQHYEEAACTKCVQHYCANNYHRGYC